MTPRRDSLERLGRVTLLALIALGLAAAALDTAIGWFIPIAVVGGGLTAALLIATANRGGHAAFVPDRFERGRPFDVMNMSSVRVAGIGGSGLLLASTVVGFQFALTTVVLLVGVTGGALGALALIVYRRRHGYHAEPPLHLF